MLLFGFGSPGSQMVVFFDCRSLCSMDVGSHVVGRGRRVLLFAPTTFAPPQFFFSCPGRVRRVASLLSHSQLLLSPFVLYSVRFPFFFCTQAAAGLRVLSASSIMPLSIVDTSIVFVLCEGRSSPMLGEFSLPCFRPCGFVVQSWFF